MLKYNYYTTLSNTQICCFARKPKLQSHVLLQSWSLAFKCSLLSEVWSPRLRPLKEARRRNLNNGLFSFCNLPTKPQRRLKYLRRLFLTDGQMTLPGVLLAKHRQSPRLASLLLWWGLKAHSEYASELEARDFRAPPGGSTTYGRNSWSEKMPIKPKGETHCSETNDNNDNNINQKVKD